MKVKRWTALCVVILIVMSFICAMPAIAETEERNTPPVSSQEVSSEGLLRSQLPLRSLLPQTSPAPSEEPPSQASSAPSEEPASSSAPEPSSSAPVLL